MVTIFDKNSTFFKSLKMCMRDFTPVTNELEGFSSVYDLKMIELEETDKILPYMAFLTFILLLNFKYYGKEEKVAWSIPFIYKEKPFVIYHQKFGFRVASINDEKNTTDLAREMLRQLTRGIKIADGLLKPIVENDVKNGDISVVNKHYILYDSYSFFRAKAKEKFKKSEIKPQKGGLHQLTNVFNRSAKYERQGFYYTTAMLDAFYSWLEHVLVLLVPFCEFKKNEDDIENLISADWTRKFNRVLKPDEDKDAHRLYNELWEIKENYRNTLAHGFFDKTRGSILVHTPVVGAIPICLSSYSNTIYYNSFHPITKDIFPKICKAFDKTEKFLRTKKFPQPFAIIESGLDIRFDDKGLAEYKDVIRTPEETNSFIEVMSGIADDAINMDWSYL